MWVGTAHSVGFQGAGSPAADAALPLMVAHHSALASASHCFVIVIWPLVIVPQRLNLIFILLHSLVIPALFLLGFHRCYTKQYILCIECHENTYKIKSVRAGVSTNSTAPTAL